MLAELDAAGFLLGIATGKSRAGLDRALAQQGIGGHFAATRCADEGLPKPHPDMLLHLMDRAGVEPRRDADDRRHDARPRARAQRGRAALAVAYGAHAPTGLDGWTPLATVHSVAELRAGCATRVSAADAKRCSAQTSIRMTPWAMLLAIASLPVQHAELADDVGEVKRHGPLGDAQLEADLGAGHAVRRHLQALALAGAQRRALELRSDPLLDHARDEQLVEILAEQHDVAEVGGEVCAARVVDQRDRA